MLNEMEPTTQPALALTDATFHNVFDREPARGRSKRGTVAQARRAKNSNELTALFAVREELQGVSAVADVVVEQVRWSA